jgi:phospholipase D1/2
MPAPDAGAPNSDGKKAPEETITVPIPPSAEEAKETVKKFEDAARVIRGDEDVSDNVSQHALMDKTRLEDEKWLGTPEEELDW